MTGLLIFVRIITALLPLAMTPVLLRALASGDIDLGGGEKDLVWLLPWALWSLVFAVSALLFWRRGWALQRSLIGSALIGFVTLAIAAVLLASFGVLGVGGRF